MYVMEEVRNSDGEMEGWWPGAGKEVGMQTIRQRGKQNYR